MQITTEATAFYPGGLVNAGLIPSEDGYQEYDLTIDTAQEPSTLNAFGLQHFPDVRAGLSLTGKTRQNWTSKTFNRADVRPIYGPGRINEYCLDSVSLSPDATNLACAVYWGGVEYARLGLLSEAGLVAMQLAELQATETCNLDYTQIPGMSAEQQQLLNENTTGFRMLTEQGSRIFNEFPRAEIALPHGVNLRLLRTLRNVQYDFNSPVDASTPTIDPQSSHVITQRQKERPIGEGGFYTAGPKRIERLELITPDGSQAVWLTLAGNLTAQGGSLTIDAVSVQPLAHRR